MKSLSKYLTWGGRIAAALAIGLAAQASMAAIGTIVGSKHDFTSGTAPYKGGNNLANQVCIYCHAPHNNKNAAGDLLWNHAASVSAYTLYSSPTMNATVPGGVVSALSKVCLSCHDGTVAVDSFGSFTGTVPIAAGSLALIGPNLSNDHPISITYDAALIALDPGLRATTTAVTIGTGNSGTIDTKMLFAGKLECSSCHDVHNSTDKTAVESKLVKVTTNNSALCIVCHNK